MVNSVSNQLPVLWRGNTLQPVSARGDASASAQGNTGTEAVPGSEEYRQLAPVAPVQRRTREQILEPGDDRFPDPAQERLRAGQTRAARDSTQGTTNLNRPVPPAPAPDAVAPSRVVPESRLPQQPPPAFTGYRPLDSGATGFSAQYLGQTSDQSPGQSPGQDGSGAGSGALANSRFRERAALSYQRAAALPADQTFTHSLVV